jgi:NhaA family Na+:H+ antiporter
LREIDVARREALSPSESLIEVLHPWVAYAIMPIFALANAGVSLYRFDLDASAMGIAVGASAGLLFGKPIGVLLASVIALRSGLATLPRGLHMRHLLVLGLTAGIGFTMSLFIGRLAFVDSAALAAAKLGVLVASGTAAALALLLGALSLPARPAPRGTASADETEASALL